MILSIIIPIYNVEKYVKKTLESITKQLTDLLDIEIVVVNDGTPDNSMDIVNTYVDILPNLVIINQNNGGLSNARNTGLSHAQGRYVWFVDSDDWVCDNSLKSIKERLFKDCGETDVFCYKIQEFDEDGYFIREKFFPFSTTTKLKGYEFLLSDMGCTPMQQYIIKRDFLNDNNLRFVDGIVHEDVEFAPRMLLKTNNVCAVPEVSYCYLLRTGDNITGSRIINEKRLNSLLYILHEYVDMENEHSSKYAIKCIKRIQKTAVFSIYNYSDVEQIKNNFMDAFSYDNVKEYKRVVLHCLELNNSLVSLFWNSLFLISPLFFKRFLCYRQKQLLKESR